MSVLASFVGGWGHAEPLIPVARLAVEHGHRVTFAGQSAVLPRLASLGFETVVVGPDTLSATRLPLVPVDREKERAVARDHFVGQFGALRAERLSQLIAETHPHVVVCDEVDAGAVVAAEVCGTPCVTVGVIAAGRVASHAVIGSAWDRLRDARGLPPDPHGARFGGTLRVTPAPASFRDPTIEPAFLLNHVRPPILDDIAPPPRSQPGRRLVYATLGTVFDVESGDLFERLTKALSMLHADSVLTIGSNVRRSELPPVPNRVRIEPFVDQRELLSECAAVICHGGTGTTIGALSVGVPVVVLPMGADQPDNADRCEDLGVGIVLDPITASPTEIAGATRTLIDDERFAHAAAQLAAEAAAQPPLQRLTELQSLLSLPHL
jgi:UDP:flavonoid glycosyltransferase YjiC (YdhE family)